MCIYSLEASQTRKGKRGEKLVTHRFIHASGFAPAGTSPGALDAMAVCMLPGAEIAFAAPPRYRGIINKLLAQPIKDTVATLVQVNGDNHKDALKFPGIAEPVLLNDLAAGQLAKVISLSVQDEPVHGAQLSVDDQMRDHGVVVPPPRVNLGRVTVLE